MSEQVLVHAPPFPGQRGTGGGGGHVFDSGCNLSGVKKVTVWTGGYVVQKGPGGNRPVVLRMRLQFYDGYDTSSLLYGSSHIEKESPLQQEFEVSRGEDITKVLVWAAHEVWAIQFYTNQGRISGMFGGSPPPEMKAVEYAASDPKREGLTGFFGAYGAVLDRVGFAFGPTASMAFTSPSETNGERGTGAKGGSPFDTGRNLSGVRQVVVWYGCDSTASEELYIYHIKLQFNDDTDTSDIVKGPKVAGERTQSFNVPAGTSITKAFVWADDRRVRAVQFLTDRGDLSGILGAVHEDEDDSSASSSSSSSSMQAVEYSGQVPGESLVGMYGSVEGSDLTGLPIIRLGFTFCQTAD